MDVSDPIGISIDNISDAECNNTTCTTDDTFTADVMVTYGSKPASGTFLLTGPLITVPVMAVDVTGIGATSYTFTGVEMLADGGDIDLTAAFSEGCSLNDETVGTAPGCDNSFTPSEITVSGFGCFGLNGIYFPVGTQNGAPIWQSMNDFFITWENDQWVIVGFDFMFNPTVWSANSTDSITNLPCTGGWTDPLECAENAGSISLSGGCGDLSGGNGPACDVTDISLDNTSGCDDNGTADDTDDYFTTDVTVTFAYTPSGRGQCGF